MFLGFICGSVALLLGAAPSIAQDLSGEWGGTIYLDQAVDAKTGCPARMVLEGTLGSMEYPSQQCGGSLFFFNKSGNTYLYRENLTYGRENCVDGGIVAVTPHGNSVEWRWYGDGTLSGINMRGTLTGTRRLPSCTECTDARTRCLMACDRSFGPECVVRCSQEYRCVMGDDCY